MKIICKILAFGTTALSVGGCDLTMLPEHELSPEQYFQNESDLTLWSNQFYNDNPDAGAMYRKFGILALEMETAGLYWTAQRLGKRALSLLTISDHIFTGESLSAQERQDSFHEMMEIALETAWKSLEG